MDEVEEDLFDEDGLRKRHVPVNLDDVRELKVTEISVNADGSGTGHVETVTPVETETVNVFETAKQDPVDRCTCDSEEPGDALYCPEHGPDKGKDLRVYPLVGVLAGEKVDVGTFEVDAAENWTTSISDMDVAELLEYKIGDERFSIRLVIDNKTGEGEAFIIDNKKREPARYPLYIEDGVRRHYIGNAQVDEDGHWSIPYLRDTQANKLGFTEKVRAGLGWQIVVEDERAFVRVAHLDPTKDYEPWHGSPEQYLWFSERFREASRMLLGGFLKLEEAIQGEGSISAAFQHLQEVLKDCTMDAVKLADNLEASAKAAE